MQTTISSEATAGMPPARKFGPWAVVALLMALCFLSHLNRISMSVAGDARIMKEYGLSPTQMGSIYSAFLVVYTVAMIPGGWLIDRVGSRASLGLVGLGSALFVALTGLVGWCVPAGNGAWVALVGVRGLMGAVSAPLHPGCARAAADWMPAQQRSLANGLITGAAILGVASSFKIFGGLIDGMGWPAAFLVMAGVTAAWGAVWLLGTGGASPRKDRVVAASGRSGESTTTAGVETPLLSRSLVLLTASYAAVGYFQYLFFYWMHYYFQEVLKLGKGTSESYASIPPLAMAIGMPVGGWVTDCAVRHWGLVWGRRVVPLVCLLLGGMLLLAGLGTTSPVAMVAWFSAALGAVGGAEGAFWSTAVEAGGRRGATAAGIVNMGGNAGGLLAPVATPWLAAQFHWQASIAVGGAICLVGALCWLGIGEGRRTAIESRLPH